MKPSVFIGSSSAALPIARRIKSVLERDFNADCWDENIFALGEDILNNLQIFIQCYDFAILVLAGDDIITSRSKTSPAPRDNVIFELGLFMGALGRRRTFAVLVSENGEDPKIPSDLFGNNVIPLAKEILLTASDTELAEKLNHLTNTLAERSRESILQLLPSTGLAIGYFQNFVLPVCQELANRKEVTSDGVVIDISQDNFDFNIVLPKTLSDASTQGAKRFAKERGISEFILQTPASRKYPFYVASALKDGRLTFYDYPTTLRASHEAIRVALAGPFLGHGNRHTVLDQKEIANFARTLDILLKEPAAAEFRDNVNIIHL